MTLVIIKRSERKHIEVASDSRISFGKTTTFDLGVKTTRIKIRLAPPLTFKDAIIELTTVFIALYVVWIISENIDPEFILQANVYGGLLIFLSIFRTLFTLFLVSLVSH